MITPIPYEKWRAEKGDRAEDAASNFGFYLMTHCRAEALKKVSTRSAPATKAELDAAVTEAVDTALHNVWTFWKDSGSHTLAQNIELSLHSLFA